MGILAFLWLILIYSMTGLVPSVEKMLTDMRVDPDPFSGAIFVFSHLFKIVYVPATIGIIVFALACWRSMAFRTVVFSFVLTLETAPANHPGISSAHLYRHLRDVAQQ